MFQKAADRIRVATRLGGAIIAENPSLQLALSRAKAVNLPKDRIEAAIAAASRGDASDNVEMEDVVYEGTFAHGAALLIECSTDSRARTVQHVRLAMKENEATFGAAVKFLFRRVGILEFEK